MSRDGISRICVAFGTVMISVACGGPGGESAATNAGASGAGGSPQAGTGGTSCGGAVTFADAKLEEEVRQQLGISSGDIPAEEASRLSRLDAECVLSSECIGDLSGIECLTGLRSLNLGSNDITDIGPLSELTVLEYLYLGENSISDVTALSRMTALVELYLNYNAVSDLTALAGLASLEMLELRGNDITDIGPLSELTALEYLYLGENNITDIAPLVENTGLGDGDQVWLDDDPLDCTEQAANIQELLGRGVNLTTDCSP